MAKELGASVLERLSRGEDPEPPFGTYPETPHSPRTQAAIDLENENIIALLRRSAKLSKKGSNSKPQSDNLAPSSHASLPPDPEKSSSIVSLPPEGQSSSSGLRGAVGPLGRPDLMDSYIFKSFRSTPDGISTERLDTVLARLKQEIPDIEVSDLEEHLSRMEKEGKISINVTVTFDKDRIRLDTGPSP